MMNFQHIAFSIPIWGVILNEQKYQSFNYIEKILELREVDLGQQKSNFGGFQSNQDLNITEPVFRELMRSFERVSLDVLQSYNPNIRQAVVTEMWGNVNHKHCFNGAHTHGGILSGVFYLKVPPNSGRLVFCNPAVRADGHLTRPSNFFVDPEELSCIFFPSWLEHYVEPNLSDELRISISFNIGVQ